MLDKNGVEIKIGDVVEITGAYFKNDNGLWFVKNSAGDADWIGSDHCLMKISKSGKISKAKHNICFWPISIFTNSYLKKAEGNAWNKEHAAIEVKTDVDRSEIAEYFRKESEDMVPIIKRLVWDFGEDSEAALTQKRIKDHYENIASSIEKL